VLPATTGAEEEFLGSLSKKAHARQTKYFLTREIKTVTKGIQ
jgi:hypothetical protein